MPEHREVLSAKRVLSARLLPAAVRGGPTAHVFAATIEDAVRNAGINAHGVGIGHKLVHGVETDELCVRIHVAQKMPPSLIPPRHMIPAEIDGIATDVIESPPAMIMPAPAGGTPDPRSRQRPVVGGISAAQFEVTAGTISGFCRSTRHGDDPATQFVLSNNHIFANVNKAQIGDDIYQQSPLDDGHADDTIARLHRFVPLHLNGTDANLVDAAIGEMNQGVAFSTEISQIGPVEGTAEPTPRMEVRKHGRTSGYTEGKISDTDYDAIVGMDHVDPSVRALFQDQIRIDAVPAYPAFGLGGDSGSLVVDKNSANAVGLYFAGPGSGSYGIANHIGNVLSALEIEIA